MPEENSFLSSLLGGEGNPLAEGGVINNLLQNKLFLQGLAATGASIGGKGSVGAALGGVANQSITAQNYSKLLSRILGQGGKMTMDKDKFSLSGPSSILGGEEKATGSVPTSNTSPATNMMSGVQPNPMSGVQPNPFLLAP